MIAMKPTNVLRRFWRDERGAAIIFTAASVLVLAGFIALVYNLGQATERRTQVQLAADSAVYSGAMVQANALSAIAWTNDGMAQIYTNLCRYAVDVCTTGVAAELERQNGTVGSATAAYNAAYAQAQTWLPRGKEWIADLSRIQHAVALVTPRIMQETMYDVAVANGAEFTSLYPTSRLFPADDSEQQYRIEQFGDPTPGWRITNLLDNEMLWVYLDEANHEWHIVYSESGITQQEIIITEDPSGDRWVVRRLDGSGSEVQIITLINDSELGWIVSGYNPGDPTDPGIRLQFERVDMDGDGVLEGTKITVPNGNWQVFWRNGGNLYLWNKNTEQYDNLTVSQTTVGGIPLSVNATNVIQIPGGSITVGDPVHVRIGRAELVLSDPPTIHTGIGSVHISVRGFDPSSFHIACNGFTISVANADGRWRKYYNPSADLWWRHRLTEEVPVDPNALHQWQYDYQLIGPHLQYEPTLERFVRWNGLDLRTGGQDPLWLTWFDVSTARPAPMNTSWRASQQQFSTTQDANGLYQALAGPPSDVYYRTAACTQCLGSGRTTDNNGQPQICSRCGARDHDGDGASDIRVAIGDVVASAALGNRRAGLQEQDYLDLRVFDRSSYNVNVAYVNRLRPLVLSEEFWKYGLNVATWREPEAAPMLFDREPDWGFVAVSSARIGVPTGSPSAWTYLYKFDSLPGSVDAEGRDSREQWCEFAPENLYRTQFQPRLVSARRQVHAYDLEHLSTALTAVDETPTSYLWSALMFARYSQYDEPSTWLNEYDGRTNRDVPGLLRNMRDREGRRFPIESGEIEAVIHH